MPSEDRPILALAIILAVAFVLVVTGLYFQSREVECALGPATMTDFTSTTILSPGGPCP